MFCEKCGKEMPNDAVVCPECGAPTGVTANAATGEVLSTDAGKKNLLPIIGIAAGGVVVVILLIVLLSKVLGGGGKVSGTVEDIQAVIGSKGAAFEISVEGEEVDDAKVEGWYTLNTGKQKVDASVEMSGMEMFYAVRDGEAGMYMEMGGEEQSESVDIDDFADPDFLFDTIKDLGKKDITKLDYEGIIEELELDDVEDYIAADDMGKAVGAVLKALDKNAEECMGYKKKGKTVTYDIEVYDTLVVVVEALEKYFADEDYYEELVEGLEDAEDYLKEMDNIEIEIVKDGKYISEITIDAGEDANIKIELSDVDKVKEEIDEDILDEMF